MERALGWIWHESSAFNRFRGTEWMPLPCRECKFREVDFGRCHCQAALLAGDASVTDPACSLPMNPHRRRNLLSPTLSSTIVWRRGRWSADRVGSLGCRFGRMARRGKGKGLTGSGMIGKGIKRRVFLSIPFADHSAAEFLGGRKRVNSSTRSHAAGPVTPNPAVGFHEKTEATDGHRLTQILTKTVIHPLGDSCFFRNFF